MPQRNQEKDSNGKTSLLQEEGTIKEMIEKMPQEKNGEDTDLECDRILCKDMDSEKEEHRTILKEQLERAHIK